MAPDRYMKEEDEDVVMEDDPSLQRKGRGFDSRGHAEEDGVKSTSFEILPNEEYQGREAKSVEGWIIIVTNVHEEATEEDVMDKFADYGEIKSLHLNLDRRTGYVKGYALIEFATNAEAKTAIHACEEELTLMDQRLFADFAFVQPPARKIKGRAARRNARARSRSPGHNEGRELL